MKTDSFDIVDIMLFKQYSETMSNCQKNCDLKNAIQKKSYFKMLKPKVLLYCLKYTSHVVIESSKACITLSRHIHVLSKPP